MNIHTIRIAVVAGLSVALGTTSFAAPQTSAPKPHVGAPRPGMPHGPMGGMRSGGMAHLGEALGLTAAQKAKIIAVMQKMRPQHEAIRNNPSLSPAQKSAKMQAIAVSMGKQFEAILTPAQRKKRDAMRDAMMKQFRASHPNFPMHK